jgi:hypothetical protein
MSTAAPLQAASAKPALSSHSIGGKLLQRKCACGSSKSPLGEMCDECQSRALQRKLAIGTSNDPMEQEADRIADQVMAAPAHPAVSTVPPRIQRLAAQPAGQMDTAPASVDRVLSSPGRPLEPALRQDMEQRFGHDFSQVQVHSGAAAEQSARDVNALAYTVGHHVVFGASRFAPATHEGRQLLTHELTHVVQQTGSVVSRLQRKECPSAVYGKEQDTEVSWSPLTQAAERLSMASLALYKLDPLLELVQPKSNISASLTRAAIKWKVAQPFSGPSEKIEVPFSFGDLRDTLRAFENSLVSHLRQGANVLLDATGDKLCLMDKLYLNPTFYGQSKEQWKRHRSYLASKLESQIEILRNDPDVLTLELDHEAYKRATDREARYDLEHSTDIAGLVKRELERNTKLEKEQQQYQESLRKLLIQKSPLYLLQGTDIAGLLREPNLERLQNKLDDLRVDAGMKLHAARMKLDDRKFLYGADILIDAVKERLTEWLKRRPRHAVIERDLAEDPLSRLVREELLSQRAATVNFIIDKLASERKAETRPWEDIVKVLQVVSMFVPGPIGWGIRIGVAAAGLHTELGRIEEQEILYGTLSRVAPDPSAKMKAQLQAGFEVVTAGPLKRVPLPKKQLKASVGTLAPPVPGTKLVPDIPQPTTALREGERSLVRIGDEPAAKIGMMPKVAERKLEQSLAPPHDAPKLPPASRVETPPASPIRKPVPVATAKVGSGPIPAKDSPDFGKKAGWKIEKQADEIAEKEIKNIGSATGEALNTDTANLLRGKHALRSALAENDLAAKALKHCSKICFPENVTPEQVRDLGEHLLSIQRTGPYNTFLINNYLYKNRDNLQKAINDIKQWKSSRELDDFLKKTGSAPKISAPSKPAGKLGADPKISTAQTTSASKTVSDDLHRLLSQRNNSSDNLLSIVSKTLYWSSPRGAHKVYITDGGQLIGNHKSLRAFVKSNRKYANWDSHHIIEEVHLENLGIRQHFPSRNNLPCVLLPPGGHKGRVGRILKSANNKVNLTPDELYADYYSKAYDLLGSYTGIGSAEKIRAELSAVVKYMLGFKSP